jgi:hypothetical protein
MARLPDTAGQLKNAPVKVIRGFFSGIGQLLLAADRFRDEEAQREGIGQDDQHGSQTGLAGTSAGDMTTAEYVRSAAPGVAAEAQPGRHRKQADAKATRPTARKKGRTAHPRQFRSLDSTGNVRVLTPDMPAEPSPGEQPVSRAALPVSGYDGLSVASLRSRLRNLDAMQLATLLDYERSAANRADVVAMFERRIAKLEAMRDAP